MNHPPLKNLGSLITYQAAPGDEKETCLGYLMDFSPRGVFDAHFGQVDVTPPDAATHNRLLDEAYLKGLDESCQVGQGTTFYFMENKRPLQVTTFCGTVVSCDVSLAGKSGITFRRKGKLFRGRRMRDAECVNFRRAA